jgi:hypothetical protein
VGVGKSGLGRVGLGGGSQEVFTLFRMYQALSRDVKADRRVLDLMIEEGN